MASGPCRNVLVHRGLVEPVWPRAHFRGPCLSSAFDVSDWLRAFVGASSFGEGVLSLFGRGPLQKALLVENVLSLRLASGLCRSIFLCQRHGESVWPLAQFRMRCLSRTFLTLRLASGPCRNILVCRGCVESVWPRAIAECVVCREHLSPIGLGPLSECPHLSRACWVYWAMGPFLNALFVENVLSLQLASGPCRSVLV